MTVVWCFVKPLEYVLRSSSQAFNDGRWPVPGIVDAGLKVRFFVEQIINEKRTSNSCSAIVSDQHDIATRHGKQSRMSVCN